eukprot:766663-Hanusia_phi.AAC.1
MDDRRRFDPLPLPCSRCGGPDHEGPTCASTANMVNTATSRWSCANRVVRVVSQVRHVRCNIGWKCDEPFLWCAFDVKLNLPCVLLYRDKCL